MIYLVTTGTYSQRTIICAFAHERDAWLFKREYEVHPPRSLGPVAPVEIIPVDYYTSIEDALQAELQSKA